MDVLFFQLSSLMQDVQFQNINKSLRRYPSAIGFQCPWFAAETLKWWCTGAVLSILHPRRAHPLPDPHTDRHTKCKRRIQPVANNANRMQPEYKNSVLCARSSRFASQ